MMFFRTKLPTFSSERYYLLSELEQLVDIGSVDADCKVTKSRCGSIFYILWNSQAKDAANFLIDLKQFTKRIGNVQSTKYLSKCILSIEVLVPKEQGDWDQSKFKDIIESTFTQVMQQYSFGLVQCGVCDSEGGSPAIENIMDLLVNFSINNTISGNEKISSMYLNTAADVLGFNPNRSPDAASNVFQILYSSMSNDAAVDWSNEIFLQRSERGSMTEMRRSNPKTKSTHMTIEIIFITLFLLLASAIFASILWSL